MNSPTPTAPQPSLTSRVRGWLVEPAASITRQDDRRQARFLSRIQLTLLCLNTIGQFTSTVESGAVAQFLLWITLLDLVAYLIGRTYYYRISAALTIGTGMAAIFISNLVYNNPTLLSTMGLVMWSSLTVLLCSMFFKLPVVIFQAALNLILLWLIAHFRAHLSIPIVFAPLLFIITISILIMVFSHHRDQLERDRLSELSNANRELEAIRASLEERVAERTHELQLAYETMQSEHEKLMQSEKMASLGRLTGGIAHEINTPLAASRAALAEIQHLTDEYQASLDDPAVTIDDYREISREMSRSFQLADGGLERIAGFVRGIKTQIRDTAPRERALFNAVPVIRESLLLVNHALRAGRCTVSFEPPSEDVQLFGVPGQLSQIITNLVANAIDASQTNGGGPITLQLLPGSQQVELLVSDQGSGISPEVLPRVFDLLFTTKPSGHGTGLGLTIVHDIMSEVFDGTIQVASPSGQGSTFILHFPSPGAHLDA